MTKRIIPLDDFISASEAAHILSEKLGRPVRPDYIHQIKNIRFVKKNDRCKLYNRDDIEACVIRQKGRENS